MASVAKRLITAEEFALMPGSEHMELIRGEVVEEALSGAKHGQAVATIGTLLYLWAKKKEVSREGISSGFVLAHNPDTVRGPDIYYISPNRVQSDDTASAFWTTPPDLAVEVISPSETADDIRAKVRDFLAAGTPLVWTIHPASIEVIVHTPDGMARTYGPEDTIEYPDVLPGFTCKVAEQLV